MKVLISGASGLVGERLQASLKSKKIECIKLVRRKPVKKNECYWNPAQGEIDEENLPDVDAVVHLAGENVAGRWSNKKKQAIRDSRVLGTQLLTQAFLNKKNKPKRFIQASAIGYYGNRDRMLLDEESSVGEGFLPQVCQEWEDASAPLRETSIEVSYLRIGIVLDLKGGALAKMLPPFKMGLGGVVGSGRQFMSWILLEDLVGAIDFLLHYKNGVKGPVNLVAPKPVTNEEFTKALGRHLGRPTIFPLPAFVVKTLFGEMGENLLLGSTFVEPKRLLEEFHYDFKASELDEALNILLKK